MGHNGRPSFFSAVASVYTSLIFSLSSFIFLALCMSSALIFQSDNAATRPLLQTGECVRGLSRHTKPVVGVAWLPDGKSFVSASVDKTIIHWVGFSLLLCTAITFCFFLLLLLLLLRFLLLFLLLFLLSLLIQFDCCRALWER